jgi:hypothetical protein
VFGGIEGGSMRRAARFALVILVAQLDQASCGVSTSAVAGVRAILCCAEHCEHPLAATRSKRCCHVEDADASPLGRLSSHARAPEGDTPVALLPPAADFARGLAETPMAPRPVRAQVRIFLETRCLRL